MNKQNYYDFTCVLHNTDKGKDIEAEVDYFVPGSHLLVVINKVIEVRLNYNSTHKEYVGSKAGMEFTTKGPKAVNY